MFICKKFFLSVLIVTDKIERRGKSLSTVKSKEEEFLDGRWLWKAAIALIEEPKSSNLGRINEKRSKNQQEIGSHVST